MKQRFLKEPYESAELKIVLLEFSDVITTSGDGDDLASDTPSGGWTGW